MIPKQYRLPLRHQHTFFTRAFRNHTAHFIVYSTTPSVVDSGDGERQNVSKSRAAIIVPAKKNALAVDRNRIKRQLRSIITPLLQASKNTIDLVIYVKRPFFGQDLNQIAAELSQGIR